MFSKVTLSRCSRAIFSFTACFILLSNYSHAATTDLPPSVKALEKQGLDIVQEFNVSGGLRAFAGVADGRPIAVYVTHDDKAIVGTRLDANGSPIDEKTLQNLVVKPMSKKIWAQLSSATWVRDGKADAPRIIYAFSDANCPYCHRFWEVSRPWVNAGKVQVRYIFVGVIREDSPAKAAAILGASDPSAALLENEHKFNQGGITPAKNMTDDMKKILSKNQMLMKSMGFQGTPGIVILNSDDIIKKFNGMPQQGQLADVFGSR